MFTLLDDLELAHTLADLAGDLALSYFGRSVSARTKRDGTSVTDADLAVERLMREHLTIVRPRDGILGEEFGRSGAADRTWLIDPIDGTSFFAASDPHWRVHVALQIGGETVIGVVSAPALGLRWWATRGGGSFECRWSATQQGPARLVHVSRSVALDGARVAAWPPAAQPLVPDCCTLVQPSALHLVDVLRGDIDGYVVACCHAWDHAPWILLVEEAGGCFTDWRGGRSPACGGGVFSNAGVHQSLLASDAFVRARRSLLKDWPQMLDPNE